MKSIKQKPVISKMKPASQGRDPHIRSSLVYCCSVELVTSALVVATVSAKATRNICSSLVSPGRLECMR